MAKDGFVRRTSSCSAGSATNTPPANFLRGERPSVIDKDGITLSYVDVAHVLGFPSIQHVVLLVEAGELIEHAGRIKASSIHDYLARRYPHAEPPIPI